MAKRDMTFLNGIIKSLEKELLTPATLMRIIDEPDYKSAFRALKEQGFGKNAATDEADSEAILKPKRLRSTISRANFRRATNTRNFVFPE